MLYQNNQKFIFVLQNMCMSTQNKSFCFRFSVSEVAVDARYSLTQVVLDNAPGQNKQEPTRSFRFRDVKIIT